MTMWLLQGITMEGAREPSKTSSRSDIIAFGALMFGCFGVTRF